MSMSKIIYMYLGIFVFSSIFIWHAVALYMAHKKLDMLLALFPNSVGVKTLAGFRNGGIWGKLMLIGGITGFVAFPRPYLKNGQLSRDDLQAIPPPLKFKLAVMHWILVTLATVVFALYFVVRFEWLY